MKRLFTHNYVCVLLLAGVVVCTQAKSQSACTVSSVGCANVTENFNVDNGGFTGTGFTYTNPDAGGPLGNFTADILRNQGATLVSGDFLATNPTVVGFSTTSLAAGTGTYTINIKNSVTDAVITSCTYQVVTGSSTACLSLSSASLLNQNVYFEFVYNPASGNPGIGLLTFDDFATNLGEAIVTPVTFLGFDAQKLTTGTQLTWKVGTEVNVKGYEVERSVDGRNYSSIGFVPATGQSTYSFRDGQPTDRIAFYRIKNVDLDGAFKYSNILSVKNGTASIVFNAFPLPARTQMTIQHPVIGANGSMSISTTDGRIIRKIIPAAGSMQTVLNVSMLAKGIYILRLDNGRGQLQTLKFAKE
jgi:hypothetical protein